MASKLAQYDIGIYVCLCVCVLIGIVIMHPVYAILCYYYYYTDLEVSIL